MPTSYQTERALASSATLARTRTTALAILEKARGTYPAIRRALLARLANISQPVAIPTELPILVLDALAQAQLHQNTGLAIGIASAKADAAAGGELGARLSSLLSTPASFDAEGARLIGLEHGFPVDLHILELLAGLCPLIALMTEMTRRHHSPNAVRPGAALLKAAQETTFVTSKGALNINKGCGSFFEAFDLATTREHFFYPDPVYRALISNLVSADSTPCRAGGNDWIAECRNALRAAVVHDAHPTGSPLYTLLQLQGFVEWLRVWAFNTAREDSDMNNLRTSGPAVLAVAVDAPEPVPGTVPPSPMARPTTLAPIGELIARRTALTRAYCAAACTSHGRVSPAGISVRSVRPDRLRGESPCWNGACAALVRSTWIMCGTCCQLNPMTALCPNVACTGMPFASGRCKGPGCSYLHSESPRVMASLDPRVIEGVVAYAAARIPYAPCVILREAVPEFQAPVRAPPAAAPARRQQRRRPGKAAKAQDVAPGAHQRPAAAARRCGRAGALAGVLSSNSSASFSVMAPPSSSASTMVTARL